MSKHIFVITLLGVVLKNSQRKKNQLQKNVLINGHFKHRPIKNTWCRLKSLSAALFFIAANLITVNSGTADSGLENPLVAENQNPISILIMGDSLSAAYKLPIEQGWVDLIAQQYQQLRLPITFHNASVSGITTQGGLNILPNALKQYQPQIVVIELGANDGLQGKPVSHITQSLSQLITLSQSSGAEVLLLGVRLPPNRGSRYTEPFFRQYQTLAQQHQTELVPFFLDGVAGNDELMLYDGLHPNALGQKVIAENVRAVLDRLVSTESLNLSP